MQNSNKGLQHQMIKNGAIQIAFEQLYKKSFDRETATRFYTEEDFLNLAKSQEGYQPFGKNEEKLEIEKTNTNENESILKINSTLEDSDIHSLLKFRTESVNSEGNVEVAEEEKEEIKESGFGLSRKSRTRRKRKTGDTEEEEDKEENKEDTFSKRRSSRIKGKRGPKRKNESYSPMKRRSKKEESNNKAKKMIKKVNSKAQPKLDTSNKNKLGSSSLLANNELLENMFDVHPINFDHSFHWNPTDTFIPFRMNGSGFI